MVVILSATTTKALIFSKYEDLSFYEEVSQ